MVVLLQLSFSKLSKAITSSTATATPWTASVLRDGLSSLDRIPRRFLGCSSLNLHLVGLPRHSGNTVPLNLLTLSCCPPVVVHSTWLPCCSNRPFSMYNSLRTVTVSKNSPLTTVDLTPHLNSHFRPVLPLVYSLAPTHPSPLTPSSPCSPLPQTDLETPRSLGPKFKCWLFLRPDKTWNWASCACVRASSPRFKTRQRRGYYWPKQRKLRRKLLPDPWFSYADTPLGFLRL